MLIKAKTTIVVISITYNFFIFQKTSHNEADKCLILLCNDELLTNLLSLRVFAKNEAFLASKSGIFMRNVKKIKKNNTRKVRGKYGENMGYETETVKIFKEVKEVWSFLLTERFTICD